MSFAVNDIVDNAQEIFPDCSDTRAIKYLNRVRADVLKRLGLRRTSADINLTADTREYTLTSTFLQIDAVHYVVSADEQDQLRAVSLEELNAMEPEWRELDSGTPRRFYLSTNTTVGAVIGLVPEPDTTTSSGYPKLTVYGNQTETLSAGGTIYDDIPNTRVYEYGIAYEFAAREKRDEADYWQDKFDKEYAKCESYINSKQKQNSGMRMVGGWLKPNGVV